MDQHDLQFQLIQNIRHFGADNLVDNKQVGSLFRQFPGLDEPIGFRWLLTLTWEF